MDSDDDEEQMFAELFEEEMAAAAQDKEHMLISSPVLPKEVEFVKAQEGCQKDVEHAFGVLQQRFAVVQFPAMTWSKDQMWEVMNYYMCLHNMIIENERKYPVTLSEQAAPYDREGPLAQPNHQVSASWASFIAMHQEI
jgi:hypothetical protein